MLTILQLVSVCLTTVALVTSLAHVLELPGKMRLEREAYVTTQSIYYPGFTIAGFGEILAIVATLALIIATPRGDPSFRWIMLALIALIAMHGCYWLLTHPVNSFWLRDQRLEGLGQRFFSAGSVDPAAETTEGDDKLWRRYRDRWEYSHAIRAIFAVVAFLSLLIALAF
ncbi:MULTISPECIES: anthrone oxygenase family protein [unclassified Sinorhizobium]|uniref:anthrone oxygenase family protein n=1 Tax=unclassified Sinorhizobium TaxID=2613772 RepID=UPI003523215D